MHEDSIWLGDIARPEEDSAVPFRADVVVVGAGLAGLLTAWLCAESGCSVVVVEAGVSPGERQDTAPPCSPHCTA
jgi:NADPH-dependent 2,4-dienoyl-CoA reductase/sulfur reductase-like enzyme